MKKINLVFVLALISTAAFSQVASWELSGLSGVTAGLVSTSNVSPGIASAYLSRGGGITAQSATGAYGSSGWATTTTPGATDYYQISITLLPSSLPISSFGTIQVYVTTTGPGPINAVIRSSQNAYATNIDSPFSMDTGGSGFSGYISFDLSSLAPVPAGGTLSLRLYGYDANNANAGARFDIGDGVPGTNTDIIFNAALPVTLTSFTAGTASDAVVTRWTTGSEKDNDYFVVERSGDGLTFEAIGRKDGAGTTDGPQRYDFTDEQPLKGNNYYRLRQTDFDGKIAYSPVVMVVFGQQTNVHLAPSPATDLMRIQLDEPTTEDGVWQVYDAAGRMVQSGTWAAETDAASISVGALTDGMYVLRIATGQTSVVKQFRKQ